MDFTYLDIAKMIDHSLLQPTHTWAELEAGCLLGRAYDVASVCISPYALTRCVELLAGSDVQPSTTIGFPHGGQSSLVKQRETELALQEGCVELDMVVNIGWVLSDRWQDVAADIQGVLELVRGAAAGRAPSATPRLKVIFENCYLTDRHKIELCRINSDLAVDWVKTSTGFGSGGATLADVRLMRAHVSPQVQVKAAGGIRTLDAVCEFRAAGATRCGSSRTADILDECRRRQALTLG